MLTIYKYPVKPYFTLELPQSAKVLTVQAQGDGAVIWVLLDTADCKMIRRRFVSYGTGHEIDFPPESLSYINTFQVDSLVFHMFEIVGKL